MTVSVNPGPPGAAPDGEIVPIDGTGLLIVNVRALEAPPPGAGLNTVTGTVPCAATSLDGIDAVRRVVLTKVVVRSTPFQRTTELDMNPEPFTVNVRAAAPAVALDGESELETGTGLDPVEIASAVKVLSPSLS